MAPPKNKAAAAAAESPAERVVMVALESVKYAGKRHLPGEPLLADPEDVEALVAGGLAALAELPEEPQA